MEELEFVFETADDLLDSAASPDSTKIQPSAHLSITEQAKQKLRVLHRQSPDKMLRIRVKAGGCSGYQYEFLLDDKDKASENEHITHDDVTLLLDKVSAGFLNNAIIDYQKKLAGESFQIINPNATNSCGCGVSFSA